MLDATPLFRLYARRRLDRLKRQNAAEAQRQQLLRLLAHARDTRFGRDHDFARMHTVEDYQRAVPLRRYDDFWGGYWRDAYPVVRDVTWPGLIRYFANSSGTTTGATKRIPVSREMMRANKRAAFDVLVHHLANRPATRVLGGKSFMLGGTTAFENPAPGVHAGDLSGIGAAEVPRWARSRTFPSAALALLSDWEEKTDRLAKLSLQQDIRSISGTASWLVLFFEHMRALRPDAQGRIADFYPNLELIVHGGVNFAPYRARFEALLEGSHAELREVYAASEGFIASADRGTGEGMRLMLDNGLFLEFVPFDELDSASSTRHWIANVETNVNYAIVLTTNAGLWSYVLGDTMRFVSRDPPRILITGRTTYWLSAFGEHLIGEEIERAIAVASGAIGAAITDFTVGAVVPENAPGHHIFLVEFDGPVSSDQRGTFARVLDETLTANNEDYAAHRGGDFGMRPPEIHVVPPGGFAAWMKSRGKLGGQNKVPRVIADTEKFRETVAQFDALTR